MPTFYTSKKLSFNNAEQFKESFFEPEPATVGYVFIGNHVPYANEASPNSIVDSTSDEKSVWDNMFAAKRITGNDVELVIPRINWSTGRYKQFDDKILIDTLLTADSGVSGNSRPMYILTSERNLYKCLSNNSNSIMNITTEHFQIKRVSTNKFLTRNEVNRFFPPDPITGNYILINKLRPKFFVPSKTVSQEVVDEMGKTFKKKTDDIMHFHIEGKASISNSKENGHYSPISCASYINTVDPEKAHIGLKEYIDKQLENAKNENVTPMTKEQLTRRFDLTEKARFFYRNNKDEANVFTFKIETVGVIPPLIIFHRAIDILKEKINTFITNLINKNEDIITIKASEQLSGGYDIIVKNEDDTLGNIIQTHLCLLYADYLLPKEQRKLKFIGYKRPHPLEKHIIFAIQGETDNMDTLIAEIIKPGCAQIVKVLNKIQNELEGTQQFVSELKRIV